MLHVKHNIETPNTLFVLVERILTTLFLQLNLYANMINSKRKNILKTRNINVSKAKNNIYTLVFTFFHYIPSIIFFKSLYSFRIVSNSNLNIFEKQFNCFLTYIQFH